MPQYFARLQTRLRLFAARRRWFGPVLLEQCRRERIEAEVGDHVGGGTGGRSGEVDEVGFVEHYHGGSGPGIEDMYQFLCASYVEL